MALISPTVVEQKYGIPVAQLRRWRAAGTGPEYFTLGVRSIRYYIPDLDDWLQDPTNAHLHQAPSHEHRPGTAGTSPRLASPAREVSGR